MTGERELITKIFAVSDAVRYVAVYKSGDLSLKEREGIANSSSSESDKYEELLVNPTILKIATQRGDIDCGGLVYCLIRYGNFFQLLIPRPAGHISIGIEPGADPISIEGGVRTLIERDP
jgi:hypothetical protein